MPIELAATTFDKRADIAALGTRIGPSLRGKVTSAAQAATLIRGARIIALGSFGPNGGPKEVPRALVRQNCAKYDIVAGASSGLDDVLANNMLSRAPFQSDAAVRKKINSGEIKFVEYHLAEMTRQMQYMQQTIDVAIVEASSITLGCGIVPTTSVGDYAEFLHMADRIVVEINIAQPIWLLGMHDFSSPKEAFDSRTRTSVHVDPRKIIAIVLTNVADNPRPAAAPKSPAIGAHVTAFLEREVRLGRLTLGLKPLEIGVGATTDSVGQAFLKSSFEKLTMWAEVLPDSTLDLMDAGKLISASGSGLYLSAEYAMRFRANPDYRRRIKLRPLSVSNHAGIIRDLDVISINGAIEASIYGEINSSQVGSNMMSGIGGSGEFARNALIAIFVLESTAKHGSISTITPTIDHVDHIGPDVDVLVTEQGYADLRGLSPRERATVIIECCVDEKKKPELKAAFAKAKQIGGYAPRQQRVA